MKKLELENISILEEENKFRYLFGKKLEKYEKDNRFLCIPYSSNQHLRRRVHIGATFNTYEGRETRMYEIYVVGINIKNPTYEEDRGKIWIKEKETVQQLRKKIIDTIGDSFNQFIRRNKVVLNDYAWSCFKNNGGVRSLLISTGPGYLDVFRVKKEDLDFMKRKFF